MRCDKARQVPEALRLQWEAEDAERSRLEEEARNRHDQERENMLHRLDQMNKLEVPNEFVKRLEALLPARSDWRGIACRGWDEEFFSVGEVVVCTDVGNDPYYAILYNDPEPETVKIIRGWIETEKNA